MICIGAEFWRIVAELVSSGHKYMVALERVQFTRMFCLDGDISYGKTLAVEVDTIERNLDQNLNRQGIEGYSMGLTKMQPNPYDQN